jgi:sulfite exporter TauE/SafE
MVPLLTLLAGADLVLGTASGLAGTPELAGLAVFAVIGLLGGAHCLGMCGPLVTMYADRMAARSDGGTVSDTAGTGAAGVERDSRSNRLHWRDIRQHLLFNIGRTISYATIGAVMGGLGALVFDAAAVAAIADPVRAVAGVGVGLFILGTGATYLLRGSVGGAHGSVPGLDGLFSRAYGLVTDRVDRWVQGPRIVGLGMVHGFLPCPILYPAFLYALASGSAVTGFLSLGVLGLGTIPTLFAYGTVVQSVSARTRGHLHRALGVAFLALGYIPLAMGLNLLGIDVPMVPLPVYQPLG